MTPKEWAKKVAEYQLQIDYIAAQNTSDLPYPKKEEIFAKLVLIQTSYIEARRQLRISVKKEMEKA